TWSRKPASDYQTASFPGPFPSLCNPRKRHVYIEEEREALSEIHFDPRKRYRSFKEAPQSCGLCCLPLLEDLLKLRSQA
ncbi:hypothetical protein E2320_006811, partial [Naja naja]